MFSALLKAKGPGIYQVKDIHLSKMYFVRFWVNVRQIRGASKVSQTILLFLP
jgi:capsid protein